MSKKHLGSTENWLDAMSAYNDIATQSFSQELTLLRLSYTTGCMANSLTVDDVEEVHLTPEKRCEVWKRLCCWLARKDGEQLNKLLRFILQEYGTYTSDDEPCECCGDWVETYELAID